MTTNPNILTSTPCLLKSPSYKLEINPIDMVNNFWDQRVRIYQISSINSFKEVLYEEWEKILGNRSKKTFNINAKRLESSNKELKLSNLILKVSICFEFKF